MASQQFVIFLAYLVLIVVVCYFHPPEGIQPPGEIHLIHFTPNFISTFPVQVFAFTCAQNVSHFYNTKWKHIEPYARLNCIALPDIQ